MLERQRLVRMGNPTFETEFGDPGESVGREELLTHTRWVRALALSLVGDPNRADDLVQDTWVAALEHSPRSGETASLRGWLGGVLRNLRRQSARTEVRRERREADRAPQGPEPSPQEVVERAEMHQRVVRAVMELDEPFRSTLLMRYFDELSAQEIAKRLELPSSTVRSRLQASLEKLRERMDRETNGDRRAWCNGLLALVHARPEELATLATLSTTGGTTGGTTGAIASTTTGVLAMTLKGLAATVLVLSVGFGASYAYRAVTGEEGGDARAGSGLSEPAEYVDVHEAGAFVANRQETEQGQRKPVAEKKKPLVRRIEGRVVDEQGKPVAGADVLIGGQPSPFERPNRGIRMFTGEGERRKPAKGEPGENYYEDEIGEGGQLGEWAYVKPDRLRELGAVLGKSWRTDEEGRYTAEIPPAFKGRVYVTLLYGSGIHPTATGAWHDAPAKVDLTARIIPTAEIEVWVTDMTTQKKIPSFAGGLYRNERKVVRWENRGPVVRQVIEIPSPEHGELTVAIKSPLWARTEKQFTAIPGTVNRVEVLVDSGAGFTGQVVDAAGQPVPNAFVYWGEVMELRDWNLFRGFDVRNITGGVRTDALGNFTLPGMAERVSVWHEAHSPASAVVAKASSLVLPARGSVRGRVLDDEGQPAVGLSVNLDRSREVETDANGDFVFENVEAGVHGLRFHDRRFIGIRIQPGQELVVDPNIERVGEPRWKLTSGGVPFERRRTGGVVFGSGSAFTLSEWGLEGTTLHSGSLFPGEHLFMSRTGIMTSIEVVAGQREGTHELGTASVALHIDDRELPAVFILSEAWKNDENARFWGARFFGERDGAVVRYSPLRAGRYAVLIEDRGIVHHFQLQEGEELELHQNDWLPR